MSSVEIAVEKGAPLRQRSWPSFVHGRRIRAHGALLALCLWTLWGVSVSTPGVIDRSGTLKGSDFLQFYTLGSLALSEPARLYSTRAFTARAQALVPEATDAHYLPIYGPQVALAFVPLAGLSYGHALSVVTLLSVLLCAGCIFAVWRHCPRLAQERRTVWLLAAAQPALFATVGFGQLASFALAAFTLAFLALRGERPFLAGLAFGLLAYKPQLGLVAGAVFLFTGHWRVVAGALLSGTAQLVAAALLLGTDTLRGYFGMLMQLDTLAAGLAHSPHQMHTLRAFCDLLLPSAIALPVSVLSAAGLTVWVIRSFRRETPLALRFSLLLVATVLANPHLYLYDLLVLAPAWLLLADWSLAHPRHPRTPWIRALLYAGFVLPVMGPLAAWTHVQLSVVAFAGLALQLIGLLRAAPAPPLSVDAAMG